MGRSELSVPLGDESLPTPSAPSYPLAPPPEHSRCGLVTFCVRALD